MQNGDAAAFEALYRQHQGPLFRFALLRCGSSDTAADIVQEVFMGLLNGTLKFDPTRGALQGFLFGVARNFALKRDERDHRHVSLTHDDPEGEDDIQVDTSGDLTERLIRNEQAETVRRALARIAPHYRDVLILYEMHDLSYVDIAQICHIDLGTVRSRLSRARARLAELLDDLNPADINDVHEAAS